MSSWKLTQGATSIWNPNDVRETSSRDRDSGIARRRKGECVVVGRLRTCNSGHCDFGEGDMANRSSIEVIRRFAESKRDGCRAVDGRRVVYKGDADGWSHGVD